MFDCRAPKPQRTLDIINQQSTTSVNCDLIAAVVVVDVMVRGPLPAVLEVQTLC